MSDQRRPPAESWTRFAWRSVAAHTATCLVAGLIASTVFDYQTWWATEPGFRPFDSPWVSAGPALQVLRGGVLALVLYPFRARFLEHRRGWLALWGLLVGIGILSTYGPAPGSIEGFIYTDRPWRIGGTVEVLAQSLAFSLCLVGWHRRPHRAWGWVLGTLTVLAVVIGSLAPFARQLQALSESAG